MAWSSPLHLVSQTSKLGLYFLFSVCVGPINRGVIVHSQGWALVTWY